MLYWLCELGRASTTLPHAALQAGISQLVAALPADVKYSALNVGGILLGLVGSVTYSAVSYIESSTPTANMAKVSKADGC